MHVWGKPGLTWREARNIVKYMREIIDNYGFVTVADLYDLAGSKIYLPWQDKIGWVSLSRVPIILGFRGCKIAFPPVQEINYQ